MRVLITGATGFVGRALVLRLVREGHAVTAWVRSVERGRALLGADVTLVEGRGGAPALASAVGGADAIINLAGEPVAGRWTTRKRAGILESRVAFTNRLVDAIAASSARPGVLISASAVGYYGDRGDDPLDETSGPGEGFLPRVCVEWENAARRAEALGVRVLRTRFGVVMGLGGGFLGELLPLFRKGLGASLGSGRQFVPWIHLEDLVDALAGALVDPRYEGALDLVAPEAVRMRDLVQALAAALGKRAWMSIPAAVLRLGLGEAASFMLNSQRLEGARLRSLGFPPRFPTIAGALGDLARRSDGIDIEPIRPAGPPPMDGSTYLNDHPPSYLLRSRVSIDAPIDEVFAFFSRPQNLGAITPAAMAFRIRSAPTEVATGATIDYSLRVAGTKLRWRTTIENWSPGRCFVDTQTRGPYRSWWHEHHFAREGARTVMEDRVYFAPPLGPLGRLAQRLFVGAQLRDVFGFRAQAIRLRFRAA
jgi:uncharacterized protein (TIGR01777 family)